MKRNEYSAITDLCGPARTRNLAVWMEHPTAECGAATGGSRPTAANGKFPRRSEDTKLPPFMVAVVHGVPLDNAVEALIHKWGVPVFWGVFGVVVLIIVIVFVVAKNEWLYGKFWRERRRQKEEMERIWENLH